MKFTNIDNIDNLSEDDKEELLTLISNLSLDTGGLLNEFVSHENSDFNYTAELLEKISWIEKDLQEIKELLDKE